MNLLDMVRWRFRRIWGFWYSPSGVEERGRSYWRQQGVAKVGSDLVTLIWSYLLFRPPTQNSLNLIRKKSATRLLAILLKSWGPMDRLRFGHPIRWMLRFVGTQRCWKDHHLGRAVQSSAWSGSLVFQIADWNMILTGGWLHEKTNAGCTANVYLFAFLILWACEM